MATKKPKKLKREDMNNADLLARSFVVDSLVPTDEDKVATSETFTFTTSDSETPTYTMPTESTYSPASVVGETPAPKPVKTTTPTSTTAPVSTPTTREELVESIATENYNKFIEDEKKTVAKEIEKVKSTHSDYDSYVAMLKETEYYKQCVQKWKQYYQDKKDEFVVQAEGIADALEAEAREEAIRITPTTSTRVTPTPKVTTPTPKKVTTPAPAETPVVEPVSEVVSTPVENPANTSTPNALTPDATEIVLAPESEELKFKINTENMAIDSGLRQTVEQIVLGALYDSFDATRDRYSEEVSDLESAKRIPQEYKSMVEFRWQLAEALVQSFTKIFDTTENKTVKKPYMRAVREVQADLKRNSGNMDTGLVADMILDRLYHVDPKTHEVSGIVADIVDYLTVQVQEELLKNGQVDFNLYKEACEKILNQVLVDSGLAVNIAKVNEELDPRVEYVAKVGEVIKTLKADLKEGKISISLEDILALREERKALEKKGFKFSEEETNLLDREIANAISIRRRLPNLLKVEDETKKVAEIKKYLDNLKVSQVAIVDTLKNVKATSKVNQKSSSVYSRDNTRTILGPDGKITTVLAREKGLRPITDYIVMKLLETAASENVAGRLQNFDLKDETTLALTLGLINIIKNERNAEIDVTISLLEQISFVEHDIRESVRLEPEKYNKVNQSIQRIKDLITTLDDESEVGSTKSHKKAIETILNDFIDISSTKAYGKARKKVDVAEEVETK